jgi:Xaa-Pro aminopeptidase
MKQYIKPVSARARATEARLIVASSDNDANMLWATRMFVPDPCVFIMKPRGRKYMIMSDLEVDRAREQATVHTVLPASRYIGRAQHGGIPFPSTSDILREALLELKIEAVRVPETFPIALADRLRSDGISVRVQPDPFWPEREIKTSDEIRHIGKSLRIAEEGMGAGVEALRRTSIQPNGTLKLDGSTLTSERLRGIINSLIMEKGAVPSHTIVASGPQSVDPHNEGSGVIRANSPIIIDIFPRAEATGYFGDMTRTFVRGRASDMLKRAYHAVEQAQKVGFDRIRSRANAYAIHQEILQHFRQQGFETGMKDGRMQGFFHGTGHGLGLDVHEAPVFGLKAQNRLRKNHVVTVEPGLYYAGMGGVRLEDVVVVGQTGCRNMVRFPKFLEL